MVIDDEVRQTVDAIVEAFGDGRMDDYFGLFDPDASFVFYTAPHRLASVDEYRGLWARWVDESGLRVDRCRTFDTAVQRVSADVAVVSHSVETDIMTHDGPESLRERETIVLRHQADTGWLAVHEHLSPWSTEP